MRQPYRRSHEPDAARSLLASVRPASRCEVPFGSMRVLGGEDSPALGRCRRCASCGKTVYDLGGMPAARAAALVEAVDGTPPSRLYRRADNRYLTEDCPVGRAALLRRALMTLAILAVVALASGVAAGVGGERAGCSVGGHAPVAGP